MESTPHTPDVLPFPVKDYPERTRFVRPIPARDLHRIFNPPTPANDRFEPEPEETPFGNEVGGWVGVAIIAAMVVLIFGGGFAVEYAIGRLF